MAEPATRSLNTTTCRAVQAGSTNLMEVRAGQVRHTPAAFACLGGEVVTRWAPVVGCSAAGRQVEGPTDGLCTQSA